MNHAGDGIQHSMADPTSMHAVDAATDMAESAREETDVEAEATVANASMTAASRLRRWGGRQRLCREGPRGGRDSVGGCQVKTMRGPSLR